MVDSTFAIVANGFADGPAQALREYLVSSGARRVVTVLHPLGPEDGRHHLLLDEGAERERVERRVALPSRPPWTYPLDLVVPPLLPRVDTWFGFNSLACAKGLGARRLGRCDKVVYWCVDFVDDRFGEGLLTRGYVALDRVCCVRADRRFELSVAAREARNVRHAGHRLAPTLVVPMGAWTARVPVASDPATSAPVAYLGHLVPRQGVATLLEALAILKSRGCPLEAHIVGRGPQEAELRERAIELGIAGEVRFHGFVADHREVERILASCSLGIAPYVDDRRSFTRYADPGKLKAYLAAGLPIVTTAVAPNVGEIADAGAAVVVADEPAALADAVELLMEDPVEWARRHAAALELRRRYDWNDILGRALNEVGFR